MRLTLLLRLLLFLALPAATVTRLDAAEKPASGGIPFDGQAPAPDFPVPIEWLNTERPLAWKDLRGKIVLLDFWTYCCINCIHVIPDLKKLEAKYPNELVVIGVHSAKFDNEKETDNIREAIRRYEIEHPVINDKDFAIWRSYRVRAWPTLMLINPEARIIGMQSGEGIYDLFDQVIGQAIKHFDAKNLMDRTPVRFKLEKETQPPSLLAYPGKISADEQSKRLVFSDSNHNRIVLGTLDGEILAVAGQGEPGLVHGPFESARFYRPQGVYLDGPNDVVYVADTENHAIRRLDLKTRTVQTLAGTGNQARRSGPDAKETELNSPWDLVLVGDLLYIAMAGPHQLWTLHPKTREARVHAGSGKENIVDGPLAAAALAQPSGITTDGKKLFFADSEVSAIRTADLAADGAVGTLIGQGLFEFGDVDGAHPKARLQHPLGVGFREGSIFVADTYNHKIKQLNPATKELTTVIGTGKRGLADGPASAAQLNEPSGLCFADGKMYIADANNHAIRVWDFNASRLSTLAWKNPDKLAPRPVPSDPGSEPALTIRLEKLSSKTSQLELRIALPAGQKLNPLGKSRVRVRTDAAEVVRLEKGEFELGSDVLVIPLQVREGKAGLELDLDLAYCDAGNAGLCYFKQARLKVPVEIENEGALNPRITYSIAAAP